MTYTAVGTTDENTTCDCCGRANLKMTVVLKDEDDEFYFFGRSCAARATGWKASFLDRQVLSAQSKIAQAQECLTVWTQFRGTAGVELFVKRNPHAWKGNMSWGDVVAMVEANIAELEATVAQVQRQSVTV